MKYELYTIYDVVADECGPIFQAKNFPVATRYVDEMLKGTNIKLSDYYLKLVGYFDTDGCSISAGNVLTYRLDHILTLNDEGDVVPNSEEEVKEEVKE